MATIVTRAGKGSPLTHTEMDTNFTNLNTDKSETTHNHSLDTLSNVTITTNSAGEILKWNGTAWVNNTLAEAGIAASSHTHTTFDRATSVLSGANVFSDIVVTDGITTAISTRALTAADVGAATSGHNHSLDTLSNVTITTNSAGEILKWSGTAWINNTLAEAGIAASTHNHTLDSLSNVTITTNSAGEVLVWSGTAWINQTLAEAGIYSTSNPAGYTTNTGTVTSVSGTGTVSGLTLSGTVTTSGSLTLGGTLSVAAADIASGNLGSGVLPYATASAAASLFQVPFLNTTGVASGNFGLLLDSASPMTYQPSTGNLAVAGAISEGGTALSSKYYLATNPSGYTSNTGTVTAVNKGNGMNFTNITGSGTVTLGTPSDITSSSTSSVSASSHTHAITSAYLNGSALGGSTFRIAHGSAPTTPVNGDIWTTTGGIYAQINGGTVGPFGAGSGTVTSVSGTGTVSGLTLTGTVTTSGSLTLGGTLSVATTDIASGNLGSGVIPYATASATASAFKVAFVNTTSTASGNFGVLFDSGASEFTYNPSTNTLTAGTFSGSGASLTSLVAANISSGNLGSGVLPYATASAAASDFQVPFLNTTGIASGNFGLLLDSASPMTYNPSTGTLNVAGSITEGGTALSSKYYLATNPSGYTSNTGTVTAVNNGDGMNFTNFTTSGTITLGTPSTLTSTTSNGVTASSHTHAITTTGSGTIVTTDGPTFTGTVTTAASAAGGAGFNLPHGAAPTTPNNGDLWTTTAGLYARINGSTVGPFGTGGGAGTVTSVAAGNGMSFTTITGSGSVTMGTPGTLTASTSNGVTATSHTHAITTTGTGTIVASASPTLTGTITAAAANFSGACTFTSNTAPTVRATSGTTQYTVGYRNVPQTTDTTISAANNGMQLYNATGVSTATSMNAGDSWTLINSGTGNITITQAASTTMYLAGTATTGNRTLAQKGVAFLTCIIGGATPSFIISGTGVT